MEVLEMLRGTLIALGGMGVGYFLARAVLQKEYDEKLDAEIERTKEFFRGSYEGSEDPEFMEQAIKTADAMIEYTGGEKVVPSQLAEAVTSSVKREFDPDKPIAYNRIADKSGVDEVVDEVIGNKAATPLDPHAREPYMITFAEYDAGEEELAYEQVTVSFFAGDGIVIDDHDVVITPERVEQTIGTDNLNRFGTQVDDPNMDPSVIYVRCERFHMDFEVTRSPGKYAVEVLGETG